MHTYEDWNKAFVDYFSGTHVPDGTAVYLDVNEHRVATIGQTFLHTDEELTIQEWLDDFQRAVHVRVVTRDEINLARIPKPTNSQPPNGVAFLGALVLAASYMGEQEDINERNYFQYLRRVLHLPESADRRMGMDSSNEIRLWEEWASYLRGRELVPTARPGSGTATKFTGYPISQALIRVADRKELDTHFREVSRTLDQESLMARLRRKRKYLNKHLRELLDEADPERAASLTEAIFNLYEELSEDRNSATGKAQRSSFGGHTLYAGLLRNEEADGSITYVPQPRQRSTLVVNNTQPETFIDGQWQPLPMYRGQFNPLYEHPLDAATLTKGFRYQVKNAASIVELVLPVRAFWVLLQDNDTGLYGSSRIRPDFGSNLLVLCQENVAPYMDKLQKAKLLDWGQKHTRFEGWVEFSDVQIIDEDEEWKAIRVGEDETLADLIDALRPRSTFGVSFVAGLRLPERTTWLSDYPSQLLITSLNKQAIVKVEYQQRTIVNNEIWETNQPHNLPTQGAGEYKITVAVGGTSQTRSIYLQTWADVTPELADQPNTTFGRFIGKLQVMGGLITETKEDAR